MHIIYLSGGSVKNKDWIEAVKENFDKFSTGDILYYDHWKTGDENLNFQVELKKLKELTKGKKDYSIFSKSIGSVLALNSIYNKLINPQELAVCGHPYKLAKDLNFQIDDYLKFLTIPSVFIQNEFDPLFSYVELEKVLKNNSPVNYFLQKNPDLKTHDYDDYQNLVKIVQFFFT
jgi:hypothetical protein